MTLDYRKSQPGDHSAAECANARFVYDRLPNYADAGGYHAGWGICAGTVQPTGSPGGWVQERSIHDEEVNFMRERVASSWVQRAQAAE